MYMDREQTVETPKLVPTQPTRGFRFIEWQTWPFDKKQPPYGYSQGISEWNEFVDVREVVEFHGMTVWFRDVNVDR